MSEVDLSRHSLPSLRRLKRRIEGMLRAGTTTAGWMSALSDRLTSDGARKETKLTLLHLSFDPETKALVVTPVTEEQQAATAKHAAGVAARMALKENVSGEVESVHLSHFLEEESAVSGYLGVDGAELQRIRCVVYRHKTILGCTLHYRVEWETGEGEGDREEEEGTAFVARVKSELGLSDESRKVLMDWHVHRVYTAAGEQQDVLSKSDTAACVENAVAFLKACDIDVPADAGVDVVIQLVLLCLQKEERYRHVQVLECDIEAACGKGAPRTLIQEDARLRIAGLSYV